MEFKAIPASEKNNLAKLADDALRQTAHKTYNQELTERGIRQIVRYGIAFSGKKVEVRVAEGTA